MTMDEMAEYFKDFMESINIDITRMNYFELDDFLRALIAKSGGEKEIIKARHLVKHFEDNPDMPVVVRPDKWDPKSYGFMAVTPDNIKIIDVTQNGVYEEDGIDFAPYDPSDPRNDDDGMDIYGGKKAILLDNTKRST